MGNPDAEIVPTNNRMPMQCDGAFHSSHPSLFSQSSMTKSTSFPRISHHLKPLKGFGDHSQFSYRYNERSQTYENPPTV